MLMKRLCLLSLLLAGLAGQVISQEEGEVTPTPEPPITLTIWWPDVIAHVGDGTVNPLLIDQSDAFAAQTERITFEHRLKAVGVTGGIMSSLRSARHAASNVLPSITLVRRQDLLTAQVNALIQSLEGFPSAIQGDLNRALQLGQVNGDLYGIPYLLTLQHLVYRPLETPSDDNDWSFEGVLTRDQALTFAANRNNGINDVLLLQYIANGGTNNENRELILDTEALAPIFDFYEAAVNAGIISADILDYNNTSAYTEAFLNGEINTAIFNSSQYLEMLATDNTLAIAPIPTIDGSNIIFMDAWVWVVVAQNMEERRFALEYVEWMMNAERQAEVARALSMLPARETAINLGLVNNADAQRYLTLLDHAILPLEDSQIGLIGRTIQTHFGSLLRGDLSADEALQAIADEVSP